jgi:hypothetical protein
MKYNLFLLLFISIAFYSCGTMTSTGSRFHQTEKESNTTLIAKETDTLVLKEDFDITPYKTNITINDTIPRFFNKSGKGLHAWYNYDTIATDTAGTKITREMAGYRVLIATTDNLDEANKVKSEVYSRMERKPVYISFDPPFYKVKAGDFLNSSDANEFSFKLNQMGYSDSKVIQDTVNISR